MSALEAAVKSMKYRQPIIDRVDRQTLKGIQKYGNTIDKSGHLRDGGQRLEYLAEEMTDALVYLEDLKEYIAQMHDDTHFLLLLVMSFVPEEKLSLEAIRRIREIEQRLPQ